MDSRFWSYFVTTVCLAALLGGCGDGLRKESAPTSRVVVEAKAEVCADNVDPHAAENSCLTCHGGIEMIRCADTQMFEAIVMVAEQSGTNNQCVVCHGGNAEAKATPELERGSEAYEQVAATAHAGTHEYFTSNPGPKDFYPDPGSPWVNEHTCGVCHEWEVRTQWQSLMMTEAGKIQGTLWGFGGQTGYEHEYANYDVDTLKGDDLVGTETYHAYMEELAAKEPQVFREHMSQVPAAPEGGEDITLDPSKAAFTYIRGECQRCHLGVGGKQRHGDFRGLGCSACHMPYGNAGVYEGGDAALQGSDPGRPLVHTIQSGPGATVTAGDVSWTGIPVETCTTCHNRGRRIGVSYQGLMETPYASPWQEDGDSQQKLHGKNYLKLHADLHSDAGFLCQDCHTSLDAHSSGRLIGAISGAVEVECTDCHGTPAASPWELPIGYMDEFAEEPKQGAARGVVETLPEFMAKGDYPPPGDGYLLSARGNPFGNVVREGDLVKVHLASGAVRELKPLKHLTEKDLLSTEARVAMVEVAAHMDEMECYSCHATWAPQCYGCHIKIDYTVGLKHYDWVAIGHEHGADGRTPEYTEAAEGLRIPGEIKETRSYLRWEDPPLGQNGEGRVAPVIPGCQTTVSVINKDGETVLSNHIYRIPNVEGAGEEGQRAIDMSPLHPHTVQKRARTCESCHNNPKAFGHGIGGGVLAVDPAPGHVVDLMTGEGEVIPSTVEKQMQPVPNLGGDWSRFVTEEGEQIQTVGHHFKLSRALDHDERLHMARDNVCVACHQDIPEGTLATSLLHHVGEAVGMIPKTSDEHADLVHKTMTVAAWTQVIGGAVGGFTGALFVFWLWRRRRRKKKARATAS